MAPVDDWPHDPHAAPSMSRHTSSPHFDGLRARREADAKPVKKPAAKRRAKPKGGSRVSK
jgi:hypothetical protein